MKTISISKYIIFPSIWLLFFWIYSIVFKKFPTNSDEASYILQALDLTKGNVFLKGWTLSRDNFYSLDTLLYAVGLLLGINQKSLLYLIPALIYSSLVTFLAFFISSLVGSLRKGLIPVAAFLMFPAGMLLDFASSGADHTLTYVFIIAVLILLIGDGLLVYRKYLGAILLGMACFGDPLTYFIGVIPILSSAVYCAYKGFDRIKNRMMVQSCLVAVTLSFILEFLFKFFGGFHSIGYGSNFVDFNKISFNVFLFSGGIRRIFNLDFFGHPILYLPTIIGFIHALFFCLFVCFLYLVLSKKDLFHFTHREALSLYFSVISIFILSFSFLASAIPVDKFSTHYLIFLLIDASIILGLVISKFEASNEYADALKKYNQSIVDFLSLVMDLIWSSFNNRFRKNFRVLSASTLKGFTFVFLVVFALSFFIDSFHKKSPKYLDEKKMINYLEKKGLNYGFSPYWDANVLTVLSEEKVKNRAVLYDGKSIVPYYWLSENTWYCQPKTSFFVLYRPQKDFDISSQNIIRIFGKPVIKKIIGPYRVFIYSVESASNISEIWHTKRCL